ncbi:hypothetical protein [Kitasatospora sp. NPDC093806]|uniref:hypothetical protein n=1 Tax=Kitasatospora sp. NPDC093806 TaxID=3155075 RepID=UPI003441D7DE
MPNPLDAPDAVAAAAEPLEELLDSVIFVSSLELFSVVPVAGVAPGPDRLANLAQAVYDAGPTGHRVGWPVRPFEPRRTWREILHRQVTARLTEPDQVRLAGELTEGIADLIEAHLGPVRSFCDVSDPRSGYIWWRNLLLVTDDWATILHFGVCD